MTLLIKYRLDDGGIVGIWEAHPVTHLEAQIDLEETRHGYLVAETDLPALTVLERCYVAERALQAKRELTLTAAPNPFPTEGDQWCYVSVEPFVPCTVLVDGHAYTLSEEDRTLALWSEEPRTFIITLAPMATALAEPLTVEAR